MLSVTTAACGGISEGPSRPGSDKPVVNGVVKRLKPISQQELWNTCEHCGQLSSYGRYSYLTHLQVTEQ